MYRRRGRYLYRDPDRGSSLGRPVEFAKEVERIAPLLQQNGYHLIGPEEGARWPMLLMGFRYKDVIYQLQDMEYSDVTGRVTIPENSVMFYARFYSNWVYVGFTRSEKGRKETLEGRHVYKVVSEWGYECEIIMQGFVGERAIVFGKLEDVESDDTWATEVGFAREFVEPNLT